MTTLAHARSPVAGRPIEEAGIHAIADVFLGLYADVANRVFFSVLPDSRQDAAARQVVQRPKAA
ncbi:MAG: hypothetical protein JRG86_19780 [Deltaproteobacteria bacterium]|nr:hypothetical protein [Deltaproteobacteria bacterium]MBW2496366.1 hypothetical protein [Deltaproteobacteria bacterium]